ncbi:MAG TPA: hypothetical protein VKB52_03710 [Rhodanobacteraceae bacterium]|nr:hypothetical protein [Rhodanobacteraceae bacterium]
MNVAPTLFAELKRRNVFRIGAFYAASAWLLVQVATQVLPIFQVQEWILRWIVVAAIIGLPIALGLAWYYEITPGGVKRDSDAQRDGGSSTAAPRHHVMDRAIIAVLAVAVALLLADRLVLHRDAAPKPDKSIAVLPLLNEGGVADDDYFSDGLSEELIAALAQIEGLKVIGRSSSFRFKDSKEDPRAIGKELGVGSLLEGTVRRQDDRVRIVAELVSVMDGRSLWSQTYDRELKDVFNVQADIAQAVANSLSAALLGGTARMPARATTNSVAAHDLYLKGHQAFEHYDTENFRVALGYFDQAIALDPEYALAYAERAETWSWLSDQTDQDVEAARASARSDAEKAVALAPELAEARTALGWVRYFLDWNYDEAVAELETATRLAPGAAKPKVYLAQVMTSVRRLDDGVSLARQAVEIDAYYFYAHAILARNLIAAGLFDEAEAEGRKAAELRPQAAGGHRWQTTVAVLRGNAGAALREAQKEPENIYQRFEIALALTIGKDRAAADKALADLLEHDGATAGYQIAEVYAMRGEADNAFEWLEKGYAIRDTGLLSLAADPLMHKLHPDPRFADLLTRVGLPLPPDAAH